MYQYVEEEEEDDSKSKMSNKINNNKIYIGKNINKNDEDNFKKNNNSDYSFSPKKTKLNKYESDTISRNPNLNNYSKNKKFSIPINVMNLVSFINSQTNENNNSIPTLNILSKINNLDNIQNNNMNKYIPQLSLNNNFEDGEILKKYQQNYNYLKNQEILRQSAFTTQPFSPITNNNNNNNNQFNQFSLPYGLSNKNKINNNGFNALNNFNNINQDNSSLKFVQFNNVLTKKKKPPKNMKIKSNGNINNYYN